MVNRRVLDGVAGRAALEFGNARRGLRVDGAAPIGGILRDGEGEQEAINNIVETLRSQKVIG